MHRSSFKKFACILGRYGAVIIEPHKELLATDMECIQCWLSGGVNDLLPPHYFETPTPDEACSFDILAVWAVLLNRSELVKCLCAYSQNTLPLALVLARVCRALAEQVDL